MSPQAGWLLQEEVVPRLRASIPRNVNYVGSEDAEELIQDGTAIAAAIISIDQYERWLGGDRIAAAASFHGGNLATDSDLSPHRLASRIAARVYVAGADHDDSYPPEMAARLDQALSDAGVDHRCEIYPDALHGWTMSDFPVYNEAAAERHWDELVTLFADTLA